MNLKALWDLTYGVYVIGSAKAGKLNAQIANTVFQVTSDPPLIAVSINKKNLSYEFIHDTRFFTSSSLCQETPLPFIGRFGFKSGRDVDKLKDTAYKLGITGAPIVTENATSYLEVRVEKEIDLGTHALFIGPVIAADVLAQKVCMTYAYYQQVKRGVTSVNAPTYFAGKAEQLAAEQKPAETKQVEDSKQAQPAAAQKPAEPQQSEQSKVELPKSEPLEKEVKMAKYKCSVCGYIYDPALGDPDGGIKPGTPFESLPDNWTCPVCGASKSDFEKLEE